MDRLEIPCTDEGWDIIFALDAIARRIERQAQDAA